MTMRDSRTLLLAFAAPFCFGTCFTLAKPAVTHFPPLLMMLFAYGFIAVVSLMTVRTPTKTPWQKSFIIASCAVTIQGALLFWGLRSTDSTTAYLLLQMQVPAAVLLGWLLLGEQLSWHKSLGTVIAVLGVAIVIGLPEQRPPLWPVVLIVSSGFVWALGQVLIRKWGRDDGEGTLKANALWGRAATPRRNPVDRARPMAGHHDGWPTRMGYTRLCLRHWILCCLSRMVCHGEAYAHGRGGTMDSSNDANWTDHRCALPERTHERRADCGCGDSDAGACNRERCWPSKKPAHEPHVRRSKRNQFLQLIFSISSWPNPASAIA
jgi:uncharacterized membrane protein